MAPAVEFDFLLQADLGGDVVGGLRAGLRGQGGVEVCYVCLMVFLVVQGHYL